MKFELSDENVLMLSGVGVATVAGFALLAPREHHNVFYAKAGWGGGTGCLKEGTVPCLKAHRPRTECSLCGALGDAPELVLPPAALVNPVTQGKHAVCPRSAGPALQRDDDPVVWPGAGVQGHL